jgi:hypothetical protein
MPEVLPSAPLDAGPSGPRCDACQNPAAVQWQRRSTNDPTHTVPVYACGPHAIGLAAAAQVHLATCTAPDPAHVPACSCTPEPLPAQEPIGPDSSVTLSTGWVVPTATH